MLCLLANNGAQAIIICDVSTTLDHCPQRTESKGRQLLGLVAFKQPSGLARPHHAQHDRQHGRPCKQAFQNSLPRASQGFSQLQEGEQGRNSSADCRRRGHTPVVLLLPNGCLVGLVVLGRCLRFAEVKEPAGRFRI
ncbi:MAG: hypothetical protein ABFD85_07520 [Phycisphaerae bacterium]